MENVQQNKTIDKIRAEYSEKQVTKFDKLKKLDKRVRKPAAVFSYIFGVIGSLVLGTGMCLAMKVIGNLMPVGIVVGCVGIAMVSVNYLIYKAILKSRKKKYGKRVIDLTDEILNEDEE